MSQRGARGNRYLTDEELKNKPKVTKELLVRILGYLKPYALQMTIVLILIGLSSVLGLLPTIITGRMIDEGLIQQNLPVFL